MTTVLSKSSSGVTWSEQADYRRTFGCFGSGVTVVTAWSPDAGPVGATINSFTSVSLDPPLVLWCLQSNSRLKSAFCNSSHYAIHILSENQVDISRRFCSKMEDRFDGLTYAVGMNGTPLLPDCTAIIECRLVEVYTLGDHEVLVGRVERHAYSDKAPLAFLGGNYGEFSCRREAR